MTQTYIQKKRQKSGLDGKDQATIAAIVARLT
jgi:hypothetical protein